MLEFRAPYFSPRPAEKQETVRETVRETEEESDVRERETVWRERETGERDWGEGGGGRETRGVGGERRERERRGERGESWRNIVRFIQDLVFSETFDDVISQDRCESE